MKKTTRTTKKTSTSEFDTRAEQVLRALERELDTVEELNRLYGSA